MEQIRELAKQISRMEERQNIQERLRGMPATPQGVVLRSPHGLGPKRHSDPAIMRMGSQSTLPGAEKWGPNARGSKDSEGIIRPDSPFALARGAKPSRVRADSSQSTQSENASGTGRASVSHKVDDASPSLGTDSSQRDVPFVSPDKPA